MMGPGYLRIDDDGGEMAFGCITIGLQCEVGESSIWFRFVGADKMDEVSGEVMPNSETMTPLPAKFVLIMEMKARLAPNGGEFLRRVRVLYGAARSEIHPF